jgi:hypothetical protein
MTALFWPQWWAVRCHTLMAVINCLAVKCRALHHVEQEQSSDGFGLPPFLSVQPLLNLIEPAGLNCRASIPGIGITVPLSRSEPTEAPIQCELRVKWPDPQTPPPCICDTHMVRSFQVQLFLYLELSLCVRFSDNSCHIKLVNFVKQEFCWG